MNNLTQYILIGVLFVGAVVFFVRRFYQKTMISNRSCDGGCGCKEKSRLIS